DIGIWDRPIRLAQIPMNQPVTGLVVHGQVAYLASGSDGLVVVSIQDPKNPLVLGNIGVPGNYATAVALNENRGVLAMSVANDFGSGLIRFFDVNDPELDPPLNFATLSLTDDVAGRPVDIEWQDDKLYVLLLRGSTLYLAVFDDLPRSNHH